MDERQDQHPASTDASAEASHGPASGPDTATEPRPEAAAPQPAPAAKKAPAKAAKRPAPRKAAPAKKAPAKTSPATKTTAAKQAAPSQTAPAKKTASAKKAPAKTSPATKTTAAKQAAPSKTAPAKKTASAKKAAPAKKAPAKTSPATKTTAAKQAASSKTVPAKKAAPAKRAGSSSGTGRRDFDIVVFGATGFVGRLTAQYLAEHAPPGVRIALAGRSEVRLQEVRDAIPAATQWPLITADSADPASLATMASRTRVLITTVGPYLKYGLPVVEACAEHGTHYLDLTGEVLFMRQSIDGYDAAAKRTGARIIHSCGFDSIPSDLGVFALHRAAAEDGDGALGDTRFAVVSARGGFSGGTIASLFTQLEAVDEDRSLARTAADPYALSPARAEEPSPGDGRDGTTMAYDQELQSWVSPFIMAMVNSRVVRRSNALLGYAYSKDFRYREVVANGSGPKGLIGAAALTGGMIAGFTAVSFGPTRSLIQRLLPKPGEGPDEETRRTGKFAVRLVSRTADGRRYTGLVAAKGDPGYAATAMMISQCALTVVLDGDLLPDRAGVLTPASALGSPAIDRLRAAGMTIEAHRV